MLVDGPEQAMAVANAIAPEHLELLDADPEALLPLVRHAGAVFCGPLAPASRGRLPRRAEPRAAHYGSARFAGALTVDDFLKHVHVVTVDQRRRSARWRRTWSRWPTPRASTPTPSRSALRRARR